jgi:hypothetical protein
MVQRIKISQLPTLSNNLQDNDSLLGLDTSDLTESQTGTSKRFTGDLIDRLKPENNLSDVASVRQTLENLISQSSAIPGQKLKSTGNNIEWGGSLSNHSASHESGGNDQLNHDDLQNFDTNDHIDHTSITLIAGEGFNGGGTIDGNVTFNIENELAVHNPLVEDSNTSKTLSLSDANDVLRFSNAGSIIINIPLESSVNFDIGVKIEIIRSHSAGSLGITAASGVTLNGVDGGTLYLGSTSSSASLYKSGSDSWTLIGNTVTS